MNAKRTFFCFTLLLCGFAFCQDSSFAIDTIQTKYGTWIAEAHNPHVTWETSPLGLATFHIILDSAGIINANLEDSDGKPSTPIFQKELPAGESQFTHMLPPLSTPALLAIQIPHGQCRFRFHPATTASEQMSSR